MIITRLELTNVRSYERLRLDFNQGLHVLVGPNGIGKTNVVEAIHYLSLARSFRTPNDALLVKRGQTFAAIRAAIKIRDKEQTVAIGLGTGGKKILINDHAVTRLSELSELVNVIVFEPRDVLLFDDLPRARRKFLDVALIKHRPGYLEQLTRYEKLLQERNELLKQENVNHIQLGVVTDQLIQASLPLVEKRSAYLEQINGVLDKIVKALRGDEIGAKIRYEPYIEPSPRFLTQARELYARSLEGDVKRKVTNFGPHREDFRLDLGEADIASFGSQGENRLLALALKLSPYFLIEDKERRPIIVLDDVLSELDPPTQDRLINFLTKFEQVFLTTTKYRRNLGTIHDIAAYAAQRRTAHGK
jgi:DNA replication and repair protein RecF